MRFRIATRSSALARWQADHIAARLRDAHPQLTVELVFCTSSGDSDATSPLSAIGGTGVFTAEVDRAVLEDRADAAIHSLKDLPTTLIDGLLLGAVPEREDPRDAWVPAPASARALADLAPDARVGTGSLRRRALLLERRPDLDVVELRGNVDTRLARVAAGEVDGAILALAGLRRLGREDVVGEILEPPDWLPAPGQGALGVTVRSDDREAMTMVRVLDHPDARSAVTAERTLLATLEGGCHVPIGALATVSAGRLSMRAFVASVDGLERERGEIEGNAAHAARLGEDLADALARSGAAEILRRIRIDQEA